MLGFSINIPVHLSNTHGDRAMPKGDLGPQHCLLELLSVPGAECKWASKGRCPFRPVSEPWLCFYLCLSEKSAFPGGEKLVLLLKRVKNPLSPPIHSAHCCDLLRVVQDVLLYITQMQLNSMGEGEGRGVQAPAFSVFLLIYWVTRGRQLCAAISSLENRDVGHLAL